MATSQCLSGVILPVPRLLGWDGPREALDPCAVPSSPCSQGRIFRLCRLPTWLLRVWQLPVPDPPAESCHGTLTLGNGWGGVVALAVLGTQAYFGGLREAWSDLLVSAPAARCAPSPGRAGRGSQG